MWACRSIRLEWTDHHGWYIVIHQNIAVKKPCWRSNKLELAAHPRWSIVIHRSSLSAFLPRLCPFVPELGSQVTLPPPLSDPALLYFHIFVFLYFCILYCWVLRSLGPYCQLSNSRTLFTLVTLSLSLKCSLLPLSDSLNTQRCKLAFSQN